MIPRAATSRPCLSSSSGWRGRGGLRRSARVCQPQPRLHRLWYRRQAVTSPAGHARGRKSASRRNGASAILTAASPSSSGPGRHPFKVDIAGSNPAGGTRHCSRSEEFEPLACFFFRGTPHGVAQRYAVLRRCKTRPLTPPATKLYFSVIRWLSNYLITEKDTDTQERRRYGRRGIQGAR